MNSEHQIVREVYEAKKDLQAADRLISAYMPFIRAETARFLNRPPVDGHDDELSIAMIAFHEAVKGYRRTRGSFFKYASLLIKSKTHRLPGARNSAISATSLWTLRRKRTPTPRQRHSRTAQIIPVISS